MTMALNIAQLRSDSSQPEFCSFDIAWLKQQQLNLLGQFREMPLPTRKTEHFKYNDMTFLAQQSLQPLPELTQSVSEMELEADIIIDVRNGNIQVVKGIEQTGFSAIPYQKVTDSQVVGEFYEQLNKQPNAVLKLAAALTNNAGLITIEKSFSGTLLVRHQINAERGLANSQLCIDIEAGSKARIIESFDNDRSCADVLQLHQTFINLHRNANAEYYQLATHALPHRLIAGLDVHLHRDCNFNAFCFNPGGRLSRFDINIRHLESNAYARLDGIYLPRNEAVVDYHTNIEHRAPHCRSDETFRGIVDDNASATFNGKIHIFEGAQKSDAYMNNKNLLLTNSAEINTKPELEIYADDVKCAHGATVAQLDKKAVYFLQSRGIDKNSARKMLSVGFVKALLENIKHPPIADKLEQIINARLG